MSKNIIIVILVVVILAIGGYFIFIKQSSVPAPATTSSPAAGQPEQTKPVAYSDPSSFAPSFLQCSPSELKMPFSGNNTYIITVFGIENGNCHYTAKVVDQSGVVAQGGAGGVDCKVPKGLITEDVLGHLFGADKVAGKEAVKLAQDKIEADYCTK
jgi:hypothetical protein